MKEFTPITDDDTLQYSQKDVDALLGKQRAACAYQSLRYAQSMELSEELADGFVLACHYATGEKE